MTARCACRQALGSLLAALIAVCSLSAHAQATDPKPFPTLDPGMHTAVLRSVAVDAAGRYVVTASDDKTARVWDTASGQLLHVLRVPVGAADEGKLNASAISPDGRLIALGGFTSATGFSSSIYLFDRASARMIGRVTNVTNVVHHLTFSRDGRYLAAALRSGGIRIHATLPPFVEVARDASYGDASYSVDFDAAGRLVSTCLDGKLRLYGADFKRLAVQRARGDSRPYGARFSPDGSRIAVGFANDNAVVSVVSGRDLGFLYAVDTKEAGSGDLFTVAWSPDGQTLYAAGRSRLTAERFAVHGWTQQGRGTRQAYAVARSTIMNLRALTDGRLVFAASSPGWGVMDERGSVLRQQSAPIAEYSLGGDVDSFRLSAQGDGLQFQHHVSDGSGSRTTLLRFDVLRQSLSRASSSSTTWVAPRRQGLPVTDWQNSGTPKLNGKVLSLDEYEASRSLVIDGLARGFVLGADFSLRLFNARGMQLWNSSLPGAAWRVNLSSDARYVVAALADGTIRWYRAADGSEALALFVHADAERWVMWTPEGFFNASPGAEALFGYTLNQGRDAAAQFVAANQLREQFLRPALLISRIQGDEQLIKDAVAALGDVRQTLARGLAPDVEILSPLSTSSEGEYELKLKITSRSGGVGRVRLTINDALIEGRDPALAGGMYSQRLSLAEGANRISVSVFGRDNTVFSPPQQINVRVRRSATRPALHVLAIGVTQYRDPALRAGVRFAAKDAAAVAATLQRYGYAEATDVVKPVVLTDGSATRANIEAAMAAMAERVRPNDLFVLFMAGHGTAMEDGEYYYLPSDAVYTSGTTLRQRSFSGPQLRELLARIKSSKTVVLMDTCSSGSFSFTAGRAPIDKSSIDRFARLSGRVVLAAAGDKRMALESPDNEHGIFSGALIRGLQGAADNNNGIVEVGELADYVEKQVEQISEKLFGQAQYPMRDLQGQNFPLSRKR
jgi:WD40 repeat protein